MTLETWLAFTLASIFVVLIPGPNIVLTINHAIRNGARSGLATVPGVVLGAWVAMSLSLLGAGALLATSAFWFGVLKLAGALYLLWLAYALWSAPTHPDAREESIPAGQLRILFWRSFLISLLNPKGPAFYLAFVPQFVDSSGPAFQQFAILITTFLAVATLNSLMWLLFASSLRHHFERPSTRRLLNRIGATCMVIAGLLALRAPRS